MRSITLILLLAAISIFTGCYTTEDAADVNQDRISVTYCTVFNETRGYTKSVIYFKFGQTNLRLSNAMYYRSQRLYEEDNILWGLHYARDVDQVTTGSYEWTDENGVVYNNNVVPYGFQLTQAPTSIQRNKFYDLAWTGDEIPYGDGKFTISVESRTQTHIKSFGGQKQLKIEPEDLVDFPLGAATMTISRNYSEPIDEGTQAGGESGVSFIREYDITITD